MSLRFKMKRGFTLVELMIVVAIVGVLAVLAVFGVRKYIANAKTAEARNSLGQIAQQAAGAYEREKIANTAVMGDGSSVSYSQSFCASETNYVPSGNPPKGQKYQSQKNDWELGTATAGFKCLKFVLDQPQYFQYGYTSTSTVADFTASARGDLNGDGSTFSTFSIGGSVTGGRAKIAPAIYEKDPEE